MSNPNNLPVTGFQYVIDATTVAQAVLQIESAQKRINTGQQQITRGAESFDKAIGANSRSMRVFASELLNVSGIGGNASGILTGLLAAVGPLDVALVAAGAATALIAGAISNASVAFEKHQQVVANTARSYNDLYRSRLAGLTTPEGFAGNIPSALSAISSATTDAVGRRLGDSFGQAFLLGVQGQLTPAKLVQILAADLQNPLDFLANIGANAAGIFIRAQKDAATQQYVQAAATRAQAVALQEEINKMRLAGASVDELIPKYYQLLKAREASAIPIRGPDDVGAGKVGVGALHPTTGADVDAAIQKDANYRATALAKNLYKDLRAVQNDYQAQAQSALENHQERLGEIDAQGAEARARIARSGAQARANIERSYQRQIADINENLADARVAAAENLAERIADAEASAQERRVQLDEQLADRRVSIEENYQERVKQINEEYSGSLLDAVANRDAFALLRAQQQKAKGLRDAEQQRQKELADAQKEHDKQAKELEAALAKQKAELQKDYERRIQDLEKAADKQRQKAAEGRDEQLADQKRSEAEQLADQQSAEAAARASEKKSYDQRQTQLEQAYAARKAALVAALAEEKVITEQEARAIIESLKDILKPDQITELLNDLQKAIQAKIEIKVTPFEVKGPVATPSQYGTPGQYEMGGFTGSRGGTVHPYEWVIPNPATAGYDRWQQVVSGFLSHASRTVQMPGRGGGGGEAHSLDVSISLDNNLLRAQVANSTMRTMVRVNRGATP